MLRQAGFPQKDACAACTSRHTTDSVLLLTLCGRTTAKALLSSLPLLHPSKGNRASSLQE